MAGGFATSGFAVEPFTFIKSALAFPGNSLFPGLPSTFGLKKPFFRPIKRAAFTFD
jgi:hypothetical protein